MPLQINSKSLVGMQLQDNKSSQGNAALLQPNNFVRERKVSRECIHLFVKEHKFIKGSQYFCNRMQMFCEIMQMTEI